MAKQTAEAQKASMIANLPEKTGKPLDEWLGILAKRGHEKHGDILKFLKGDYGVTHGFANLIAHEFRNRGADTSPANLVESQYAGPKAALRPFIIT